MLKNTVHEIRIGLIKVSILSKRKRGEFSYKLERLFRDGEVWRKSTRLAQSDLLVAAKALELAFEWTDSQNSSDGDLT